MMLASGQVCYGCSKQSLHRGLADLNQNAPPLLTSALARGQRGSAITPRTCGVKNAPPLLTSALARGQKGGRHYYGLLLYVDSAAIAICEGYRSGTALTQSSVRAPRTLDLSGHSGEA